MYTINIVMEALSLYSSNNSYKKTSKLLQKKHNIKITRQTVMNWFNLMKTDIDSICKKRITTKYCNDVIQSRQKTFKVEILNDIRKIINIDPFVSRKEVIDTIFDKHKIKLSQNSISSIFKKLNLTRKKPRHYVVKSIEYLDDLIVKRKEFTKKINAIDIKKIISIDEAGFNKLNNLERGLSQKGKRINVPTNEKRIKNKSLICAVTLNGILNNQIVETGVNGVVFKNFIQSTIDKLNEPGYYFIFDNVPFHHNKEMLKLIKDSGHEYVFTPPYSPNHNPIETVFGIIKQNFKKEYKEKDDNSKNICIVNLIKKAIDKFNKDYTKDRIKKIFDHSLNYDHAELEKELRDRLIIKNDKKQKKVT